MLVTMRNFTQDRDAMAHTSIFDSIQQRRKNGTPAAINGTQSTMTMTAEKHQTDTEQNTNNTPMINLKSSLFVQT